MNKLIQTLFKLAIKHIIPMPDWFIAMYIRTLTEEQKNQLAMMCRKEQKVPEDFDDYFMENLPKMLSRTGEKNEN